MSELDIESLVSMPVKNDTGLIVINRSTIVKIAMPLVPAISVIMACILGMLILSSFRIPAHLSEMTAAAVVNAIGGALSVGALCMVANKGASVIGRTVLLGTTIRMAGVLMGTFMAMGPGWGLATRPLLFWVLILYFVMLVTESWLAIWLVRTSKH